MLSNGSRKKGGPEQSHKGGPCHIKIICSEIVDIFGTKPFSCHAALKKQRPKKKKQRLKKKKKTKTKEIKKHKD